MLSKEEVDVLISPDEKYEAVRIKILIVEDSPNINLLYNRGLPDVIFDKRFVQNGHDALVSYNEWKPDIIILDVMLPVMTGYSVLKEIRNALKDKVTTIIMSTSLSQKEDVTMMMKLGIQGYILKPFSIRDIGGRILKYYEKVDSGKAAPALAYYEKFRDAMIRASFKTDLPAKDDVAPKEDKDTKESRETKENKEAKEDKETQENKEDKGDIDPAKA